VVLVEVPDDERAVRFEELLARVEAPVRRALVSAYGPQLGGEAAADALAYAWEHLDRISTMDNPAGYLWRVGQTSVRRVTRRRRREQPLPGPVADPGTAPPADLGDPGLQAALSRLTLHQRVAVVLVHGFAYPLAEAAGVLGCSVSSLRNHLDRGLTRLRRDLDDADAEQP
jgi:DNA-directed RNA polymerase specialized sigma24 family protein